jgi:pilus retraction protein PilT
MSLTIDNILDAAEQHQASDVFLQEDEIPRLKINEEILVLGESPMSLAQMTALWQSCHADPKNEMDRDSGLISRTRTRYRVNMHHTMGRLGAVLRRVRTEVPTMEELGVPTALLAKWCQRNYGFVLVTGPTGTGKSTTIAAMLRWMNEHMARHVVTIEDPIEYVFVNQQCHFTQRDVGRDTGSFALGLRASLRQAPDVIFVGEIRDPETALTALQAAETGHLVLSTLHSESVPETMERFLNIFPSTQANIATYLMSRQLIGVMCQKLVRRTDGGLHLLVEHVENGGAMRDWINRRDVDHIQDYLRRGSDPNAVSFSTTTVDAWRSGVITEEVAIEALGNEMEFRRAARGITG